MWGCEFEGIEVKVMKRVFPESDDLDAKV